MPLAYIVWVEPGSGGTPTPPIYYPPGVWPTPPQPPSGPVDPGWGQGRPLPPTVGGGPIVPPGHVGGGPIYPPTVMPPIYLPPLPPGIEKPPSLGGTPELPIYLPPQIWPQPPGGPVDPGWGQGHPLPPHVGGGPIVPPGHVGGGPIYPPVGVMPPIYLPPPAEKPPGGGEPPTIWPPLPPTFVGGGGYILVWVPGEGFKWVRVSDEPDAEPKPGP